jgi:putative transposase
MQSASAAGVTEFLGRQGYGCGGGAHAGHRNDSTTLKMTAGLGRWLPSWAPEGAGAHESFSSRLLGNNVARAYALESLLISGWVRVLSDRDIEAALRDALSPDVTVSCSTGSRICGTIKEQFAAWRTRDLTDVELDYPFVDASHLKLRDGDRFEPVLVAYGISTTGGPAFLHLAGVSAGSTDACVGFLEDMSPADSRRRCCGPRTGPSSTSTTASPLAPP